MKVLQTIPDFGLKAGGTTTATYDLMVALRDNGFSVDLLTSDHLQAGDRIAGNGEPWIKVVKDDAIIYPFAYSNNFKKYLRHSNYDIYHTNGLWMYADHITAKIAREKCKKFVLTPHGMLYTHPLPDYSIKQKIALSLFFKKDIMLADCIHATCDQEMDVVRKFGYKGPIAVIGNPVSIPTDATLCTKEEKSGFVIGYLGRLHPRKLIENIFHAVSNMDIKDDVIIRIMGEGDDNYKSFLSLEAKRLNLRVQFLGFVSGAEKFKQLRSLSVLCVPSGFENFGMIIPEALISGTPVIASLGTPWKSLSDEKCGWWIDNSPNSLAKAINEAYKMPIDEMLNMGIRGRRLIENNFTFSTIADKMIWLYKWLNNEAKTPDFVYER
nr:glycosyltransferase [uncultured Bacteroides sp.]